jgi:hypothetical protein
MIPAILHRTVPEETTREVEKWWQEFGDLNPGWEMRTYREPIDPADWPMTGQLFDRCQNGAQKAGLIRLECLYRDGGVYVDSDCQPFRSLEPLRYTRAFAGWEDAHVVPDAVLGCEKDHPAFEEMIRRATRLVAANRDAWKSGPGVTTGVLPGRDDVLLLPPGAFYPMHYLDRRSREMIVHERPPWAYLIHHYHHSWGSEEDKARLTEKQR